MSDYDKYFACSVYTIVDKLLALSPAQVGKLPKKGSETMVLSR